MSSSRDSQDSRVYVGNLPPDIRTRDIEDLFYKFGKIAFIDLKNRRGPPFAFVEFEEPRYVVHSIMFHSISNWYFIYITIQIDGWGGVGGGEGELFAGSGGGGEGGRRGGGEGGGGRGEGGGGRGEEGGWGSGDGGRGGGGGGGQWGGGGPTTDINMSHDWVWGITFVAQNRNRKINLV